VSSRAGDRESGSVGAIALGPYQRVPWAVPLAVAASWATLVAAQASGARLLDHHAIFLGGRAESAAVGLFLVGWLVMVAAMMLPSSLPAIRDVSSQGAGVGAFLGGFGAVWALFGWAALGLDSVVHRTVDAQPWLGTRPHLVAAGLVAVVGVVQFAPMKRRCLAACRHWTAAPELLRRRGASVVAGARYGQLCLGCDGGLMLLMFVAGGSGVAGMAVLSVVMAAERTAWLKGSVHRWIGAIILSSAALVAASEL
jgi:predicted metal-binding membrane protein